MRMCSGFAGVGNVYELHSVVALPQKRDRPRHVYAGGELYAVVAREDFRRLRIPRVHNPQPALAGGDVRDAVLDGYLPDVPESADFAENPGFHRLRNVRDVQIVVRTYVEGLAVGAKGHCARIYAVDFHGFPEYRSSEIFDARLSGPVRRYREKQGTKAPPNKSY